MNLIYLTKNECPHCSCRTVIKEEIETTWYSAQPEVRTHTNGQRWEHRHFLCGYSVEWVPNYSSSKDSGTCRNSPEFKELEAKREEIRKSISDLEKQLRLLK